MGVLGAGGPHEHHLDHSTVVSAPARFERRGCRGFSDVGFPWWALWIERHRSTEGEV